MDHASRALVLRGVVNALGKAFGGVRAARVERMKQRGRGIAVSIDAENGVPEGVDGDGCGREVLRAHLTAGIADRTRRDVGQLDRVDLPPAILCGLGLVGNLRSDAVDLPSLKPEQQRADGRTADVQREHAIQESVVACARGTGAYWRSSLRASKISRKERVRSGAEVVRVSADSRLPSIV
jgi:hypothetical protein